MLKNLITGPMFAGKTSSLILRGNLEAGTAWEYFRLTTEKLEQATKSKFQTHDGVDFYGWKIARLEQVETKSRVILLDEIQFASPEAVKSFLDRFKNARIFCAGLDLDFNRVEFEATKAFAAYSPKTEKRWAFCEYCHNRAFFSKKIESMKPDARFDEKARYIPCCGDCWETLQRYAV